MKCHVIGDYISRFNFIKTTFSKEVVYGVLYLQLSVRVPSGPLICARQFFPQTHLDDWVSDGTRWTGHGVLRLQTPDVVGPRDRLSSVLVLSRLPSHFSHPTTKGVKGPILQDGTVTHGVEDSLEKRVRGRGRCRERPKTSVRKRTGKDGLHNCREGNNEGVKNN